MREIKEDFKQLDSLFRREDDLSLERRAVIATAYELVGTKNPAACEVAIRRYRRAPIDDLSANVHQRIELLPLADVFPAACQGRTCPIKKPPREAVFVCCGDNVNRRDNNVITYLFSKFLSTLYKRIPCFWRHFLSILICPNLQDVLLHWKPY